MRRPLVLASLVTLSGWLRRRPGGALPAPPDMARPRGPLVWFHAERAEDAAALCDTADALSLCDTPARVLMTCEAPLPQPLPDGVIAGSFPGGSRAEVARFLDHWRPDLLLLTGMPLRPALLEALIQRDIPALLAAGRMDGAAYRRWRWLAFAAQPVLAHFRLLLVEDWRSARALRRLGVPHRRVELSGGLDAVAPPLPCTAAEHAALTQLLRNRPVWFAVGAIPEEMAHLILAQDSGRRLAHRLLLIVAPRDAAHAKAMDERFRAAGLRTVCRSLDAEPTDEVEVYLVEPDAELGLWYRLAPVTFLGGTLAGAGPARDPYEPASLGSAILHGPLAGAWPGRIARLSEGRASRSVASGADLAEAVGDLISPDRAAFLAHNGWQVVSSGAELSGRLVGEMMQVLQAGDDA